eukprot:CAMPEP_0114164830 /NCGR_PEP_ID=MMETSP0043_2-20121206/30893_1 /TAXON_ID=464988 /ORGANISM="Hemiselmis andersenii, Strain CCMP644" /LENGTH=71 /DNA_ID=CAMNT_0001261549 /DNA_START=1 /DNA_END=213 /DNA_ORIENTATION=+
MISETTPHTVQQVLDLMDPSGRMQGEQGYSNPPLLPGDKLIAVDHIKVADMDVGFVHVALRGERMTVVHVT